MLNDSEIKKVYQGTDTVYVKDETTWTLAVIPDTQRLAANNATAYNSMMQWLVDEADTENIEMVIHLGDYANDGASSTEWSRIDTAMNRLHGEVPFIHCAGNHDYDDDGKGTYSRKTATNWETVFPASDWSGYSWYVDEYDGITTNQAAVLRLGQYKYLFLTLEVFPRAGAITWAEGIITAQNPDRIILGTHMLVDSYGNHMTDTAADDWDGVPSDYGFCDYRTDADCKSGSELYNDFISQHDNIILTTNGHDVDGPGGAEVGFARKTDTVNGKTINQHFFNYQNDSSNSYADSAVLRLYKFDHSDNSCDVTTYNPVQDTSRTDSQNQFTFNYS